VAAAHARRRGHSRRVLSALEAAAADRGYALLKLETGIEQPEAVALYRSAGYAQIEKYGRYRDDPRSICMAKGLAPARAPQRA